MSQSEAVACITTFSCPSRPTRCLRGIYLYSLSGLSGSITSTHAPACLNSVQSMQATCWGRTYKYLRMLVHRLAGTAQGGGGGGGGTEKNLLSQETLAVSSVPLTLLLCFFVCSV